MILGGQPTLWQDIITPFELRTLHEGSGTTYGLGYAGYDVRLAQDINLQPNDFVLGSTLEHFKIPLDCLGMVTDKSSLARRGIFLGMGTLEPGWCGHLTLEIKNLTHNYIRLDMGQPIAQIILHKIFCPLTEGYSGKYQNQENKPVPMRRG